MIAQTQASFVEAMRHFGVVPSMPIERQLQPGKFARFPIEGDPPRLPSGWARLSEDGRILSFGSHRTGAKGKWQDAGAPRAKLAPAERAAIAERIAAQRNTEEAVAAQVHTMWDASAKADDWHPALRGLGHGLFSFGVRESGNAILVPLIDADFRLWNLMQIYSTGIARHPFKGGRRAGLFWVHALPMGDIAPDNPLVLADSFEAASAIHAPTGLPVVASMNADNLAEVARIFRRRFPRREIIVAAHDDRHVEAKPRLRAAVIAAHAIGAKVATPFSLGWIAAAGIGWERLQFGDILERIAAAERIGGAE